MEVWLEERKRSCAGVAEVLAEHGGTQHAFVKGVAGWRVLGRGLTGPHGEPLETEVARNVERITVAGAGAIEIPALAPWGLGLLALGLASAGAAMLQRRRRRG